MAAKIVTGLPVALLVDNARNGRGAENAELLAAIEELGFWGVSIPDHIVHAGESMVGHGEAGAGRATWRYADPFAMLGWLAASTRRLRIMPRVLVMPYRQPFATAHALATIDSLSGGRLVFCPGVGSDREEFETFRIPRSERGRIGDEYLDIVLALWSGEPASHRGERYAFEDVRLVNETLQKPRPPIWVGGSSEASLRRALRIGDGWTPTCYRYSDPSATVSVRDLRRHVAWSSAECAKQKRPPLEYAVSSAPPLVFLERSKRGKPRRRAEIDFFTCEGTPGELREEFLAFKDAGATAYVVNFPPASAAAYREGAEIFMREIAPAL
jgi:probable F420-dependent oxidoreductase